LSEAVHLREDLVQHETRYGATLIFGSAVLLVMGLIHPGAIPLGNGAALGRLAIIDGVAHGLAILGIWLVLVGLVGLSRMLGLQRATVLAALVAFALVGVAVVIAATLDGFVVPRLAVQWQSANDITRDNLRQLILFCVLVASSLTRIYLLLGVIAVGLWSWVIYRDRLSRSLIWVGVVVVCAGIATFFGGPAYVSVHELLALVAGQAVWLILAGMLMIRRGFATG
jgi:hypothetical protein